ncbi:MAG: hypothetical protein ABJC33_03705 [Betaproteobacteria bacterium]
MKLPTALIAVILALAASAGGTAGLYGCTETGAPVTYSTQPCAGAPARPIAVDRVEMNVAASRDGEQTRREPEASHHRDRPAARSRHRLSPQSATGSVDGAVPRTPNYPTAPLGAEVRGMRGPLLGSPSGPLSGATLPSLGPVADPSTGHVLAPAGDRLVDPLTGTMWMRSGASYVDPATGRVIPAQ